VSTTTTSGRGPSQGWLLVFGEVEGFRWVLDREQMAWSRGLCPRARAIRRGDELVLYMARGAFHNPTRDQSTLVGIAKATSEVRRLRRPVTIAGREFMCGCDLTFEVVLPERQGIPFRPLVPRLGFIRRKAAWGQYFRAGLIRLPAPDLRTLHRAIQDVQGASAT
jgi:hypothetical protein